MADSHSHSAEPVPSEFQIRPYEEKDADDVRALFVAVNRLLTLPELAQAFADYIRLSLEEEIGRIHGYYFERGGSFWVSWQDGKLVGMFGLEQSGNDAMELRRMYVDPTMRRLGIAKRLLTFAEAHCRSLGIHTLELSTSALQQEALALYRGAGYQLKKEEIANTNSIKTVGNGMKRFHFSKAL